MKRKEVNLENILIGKFHEAALKGVRVDASGTYYIINAMREACNQAIDLCAENAELYYTDLEQTEEDISVHSILRTKDQII